MLLWATLFILHSSLFISCSDFFDPSTDDELAGDEYISSQTEMYTGFLGIMTKLQTVGDKEILLTETRGELIEVADNPTPELQAVYNYEPNLQGNPYADPAGYYEVIIACNDYLKKLDEFRNNPVVTQETYSNMVSSTVRIKVWAYKTLAEIYGQAVWFDDPVAGVTEIKDNEKFQLMQLPELIDKCLNTLDTGLDGSPVNHNIDWIAWLDPANVNNIETSQYRKWNYMIPPYEGLMAELCLWKGAVLDAQQQDAKSYYKRAADLLIAALNVYINDPNDNHSKPTWVPNPNTPNDYKSRYWRDADPYPKEAVAAIIYDYTKNQTNTLLKHFSNEFPNKYLLRPSEVGAERIISPDFNPGGSADARYSCLIGNYSQQPYIAKFRPQNSTVRKPYADDVHVYLYRATQYHMMICEALNHLRRFTALNSVFNKMPDYVDMESDPVEWEGFTRNWTYDAEWGGYKYHMAGIRNAYLTSNRPLKDNIVELGESGTYKFNDMAILNEVMIEFAAEGKVYPWMNRMAVRYNDPSIIADRVCPKYEAVGKDADIRAKIMAGGYWVPYDLGIK